MFSGAKMRLLRWRGKKTHMWKMEISQPFMERGKIVSETDRILKFLENLKEEYTKILDQLLEQLPTLSENGDDKNSLIQQKIDFLKKNLSVIERGLEDSRIFLTLNSIVENIETEVEDAEKAIKSLKDNIKTLRSENNSLRIDLSMTQRKLIESEEQVAVLEIERDQQAFMNSLESDLLISEESSDEEESLDLSFIDDGVTCQPEEAGSFPTLPYIAEIDLSLNPRLKIFYNLVMSYIGKGSFEIAAPLCKTTLQDLQEKYGPNHPDVVAMMDIITLVYRGMRRYKDAIKIQLEILEIKRISMEENISIAFTLNNLAALYGKIGNVEEAENFCRRAIEFRKNILGTEHPDVAKQLCNLAAICMHTKEYNEALQCYKEALEIFLNTLGQNNYYTFRTMSNIALLHMEMEKFSEAEVLYKEILNSAYKDMCQKQENQISLNNEIVVSKINEDSDKQCKEDSVVDSQNSIVPRFLAKEVRDKLRGLYAKTDQTEEMKELDEKYKNVL